jgi:cell wall-associated NlpC family hydrolase
MCLRKPITACLLSVLASTAMADQPSGQDEPSGFLSRYTNTAQAALGSTSQGLQSLFDKGFSFLGIRYRMGGTGPESGGFDCSGLVRRVFGDALGLNLPRTAADMAKLGDKVNRSELKPGDLVFFNTMRRTFSHVGIYLGDNRFLHAPSAGGVVRVEEINQNYWAKRFTGARRLLPEAQAAEVPATALPVAPPMLQNTLGPSIPPLLSKPQE